VQAKCRSSADAYRRTLNAAQTDGVIAAGELERIKNSMLADSAEEQSARFQVAAAQGLERYLSITAPFNGVITKRAVDAGALVGTSGDKPLFELENTGTMRVRVAVPEAFSGENIENRAVNFTVKAYPDKKFSAVFKRQTQSIDAATRSETWEFETGNVNFSLKAGMVADVKLRFARGVATFVVPPSAVVTTLERRFVIKISAGHTAWVDVSKGVAMKDKVEIFGALTPGDTLAKNGSEELKADKPVIARVR
jgi:RND family efflux transporter MFP subunit